MTDVLPTHEKEQPAADRGGSADLFSVRIESWCAWAGIALVVIFISGFVIADFIPPPSPNASMAEIADKFSSRQTLIRLGLLMNLFAAALVAPWSFALFCQMRRIPGDRTTPLSAFQLILGTLLVVEFFVPVMLWQVAAYRPEIGPVVTYRLNDLAWLMFVGVISTGVLQAVTIAVAIFRDRSQQIYPRWLGYLNLWCGLMFLPAGLCVFFKSGPFAWNGLISWWLLLIAFAVWVIATSIMTIRALGVQRRTLTTA